VPDREFLMGEIDSRQNLPNKDSVLITYCDGGECELALDVAKVYPNADTPMFLSW